MVCAYIVLFYHTDTQNTTPTPSHTLIHQWQSCMTWPDTPGAILSKCLAQGRFKPTISWHNGEWTNVLLVTLLFCHCPQHMESTSMKHINDRFVFTHKKHFYDQRVSTETLPHFVRHCDDGDGHSINAILLILILHWYWAECYSLTELLLYVMLIVFHDISLSH